MQTGDRAALHTRKVTSGIDASDDALVAAYAQVRDEESKTNWCLATYKEGSKTEIVLVEQGEGGFADLVAKLPDDGIRYGVCNYTSGGRRRTFFLSWIGEGVAGMARARAGMHRQGVLNAFEGIVGDVHATDRDEVSEDNVKAALAAAVGSSEIEL